MFNGILEDLILKALTSYKEEIIKGMLELGQENLRKPVYKKTEVQKSKKPIY